mgnify:CR=1 FL=1
MEQSSLSKEEEIMATEIRVVTDWQKIHDSEFAEMRSEQHVIETERDIGHTPTIADIMHHYCACGHAQHFSEAHRNDLAFQKQIEVSIEEFCTNSALATV